MSKEKIIPTILKDRKVRKWIVCKSHRWFFPVYFSKYIQYPSASFQDEMLGITEDAGTLLSVIVAFRGSAKSTIFSMSYPIWAILGSQQKKFILILSETQPKAQQYLANIKRELEDNELLRRDLGPFQEEQGQWGVQSLTMKRFDAKIMAGSVSQSIRGLRHLQYRPDLIIVDDVESLESVKTKEGRDKVYQWFKGDVVPAGDRGTKIIVVGNLLHEDSFLRRLQQEIDDGVLEGIYREYPLLGHDDRPLWPGKFIDQNSIECEKRKVGNEATWQREYLLRIIADEDRVVWPEWIQRYDTLPDDMGSSVFRYAATGIDLAISEKMSADYTAMVSGRVYGRGNALRIYILPNPVNERLDFPKTVERVKTISKNLGLGIPTKLFIESTAYQKAVIDQLRQENYPAEEFPPQGSDKRARLSLTADHIHSGKIIFPNNGAEPLIQQIIGFGKEKHDDLVDAFSILILKILEREGRSIKGYELLFKEQEIQGAYVSEYPRLAGGVLGIVAGGDGREQSAIVLRDDNVARLLWHDYNANASQIVSKISSLAGSYGVPHLRSYIIPEKEGTGAEVCSMLRYELNQCGYLAKNVQNQYFGVSIYEKKNYGEYEDKITEGYFKLREWIRGGGKLIIDPAFDGLLDMQYRRGPDGKRKIATKEEMREAGFSSPDVSDALALTFLISPGSSTYYSLTGKTRKYEFY